MPKISDEHRRARRDQILEAALNCFSRNGYHHTSMQDIAQEAGLSIGAAYVHFGGKEEILEACFRKNQETRNDRYLKALDESNSSDDTWVSLGEYFVNKLSQPLPDRTWQLWVQVISEAPRNSRVGDTIRDDWRQYEEHVERLQQRTNGGTEEGAKSFDPRVAAGLLAAIHDGLILRRILDPDMDVGKCAEWFSELVARATAVGGWTS